MSTGIPVGLSAYHQTWDVSQAVVSEVSSRADRDFDRLLRDENFWELTKEMSPHTAPDERPLKWRWPEPRTGSAELGLYAEDDRLLGKR